MAKTELPGDVLLQCENVSLGYEGHALLTGLDLTIRQGIPSASWGRTAPASPP